MGNFTDTYEITSRVTEIGIDFFFISEGKKDVLKTIEYSYAFDHKGDKVYNLAFGDYDYRTGSFSDNQATNNGDPYNVYHTVLATIPYFFQSYKHVMLMVRGSDSTREFQNNCHLSCKRNCSVTECKKAHRRINIYRKYIDKNFDDLIKEYEFFGDMGNNENQILTEKYIKGKNYLMIFFKKRKFII